MSRDLHRFVAVDDDRAWTRLRLDSYPDGGVARLRPHGEVRPPGPAEDGSIDVVALANGARAPAASDQHCGSMHNSDRPVRAGRQTLLPEPNLSTDGKHCVEAQPAAPAPVTPVRLSTCPSIYPSTHADRGVSRLRLFGHPSRPAG